MQQTSATIKLFLPFGDAKRLRIGEISNWTGKALAAPRTDLEALLAREETQGSGIYILFGADDETGRPQAYIGEAEVIRDRLKQHRSKDFWISVAVFVSKDENLTKAHIRYLEYRLLDEARSAGRYLLENVNSTNPKLPESDREDMEIYLGRVRQMLPVLGSNLLTPVAGPSEGETATPIVHANFKGVSAKGRRTVEGFVVFAGSTAVLKEPASGVRYHAPVVAMRKRLVEEGVLAEKNGVLVFARNYEFPSPSSAIAAINGYGGLGRLGWKDEKGRTLREIEEA
jgi:hypothetical protein